jgi:integrase/recombinase XerC
MLVESFLSYLRLERNYSERTIVSYQTDLREFEGYLKKTESELDWKTVHADHVRNWMVRLMEDGRASTSVNRKLSSLRSFYRFLLRRKEITVNPMLKVVGPKKKKPLPFFVREKDMNRLLDEIPFGEGFEGCRDRTILEVFYATGMRLSELIGLNDVDVDFSAKLIKVTGKRNKQRLIPFGKELEENLNLYIKVTDLSQFGIVRRKTPWRWRIHCPNHAARGMDFALLNVIKGILLSTKGSEAKTGSTPGSEVAGE